MALPHPAYVGYRLGSILAQALPEPMVPRVNALIGAAGARVMRGRAALAARHQLRVRPHLTSEEVREAVKQAFTSYSGYWIESFRLPRMDPTSLDAGFTVEGYAHIEEARRAGRPVILALPHLGSWEWAAFWLTAVRDLPVSAVVEPVEPPELARWFMRLRQELGVDVITLGADAGAASARALAEDRILALLCDRDLGGSGIEVEFFGERTTLPGGPATLALRSGAALIPAVVYIGEDGGHRAVVRPPMDTARRGKIREDVARVTQALASEIEELIRIAPEQWHLMQPNWPSDPSTDEARRT